MNQRIQAITHGSLQGNTRAQFWLFQIGGWSGLSIISYFSLNLWYNQPRSPTSGTTSCSRSWVSGVAATAHVYRRVWDAPSYPVRIMLISAAVLLFATIWACLRLAPVSDNDRRDRAVVGLWWLAVPVDLYLYVLDRAVSRIQVLPPVPSMEHSALMRMASQNATVAAAKAAQSRIVRAGSTADDAALSAQSAFSVQYAQCRSKSGHIATDRTCDGHDLGPE
jgi:hypothetical protein